MSMSKCHVVSQRESFTSVHPRPGYCSCNALTRFILCREGVVGSAAVQVDDTAEQVVYVHP